MKNYGNVKGFVYRAEQPLPDPPRACTLCKRVQPQSAFERNGRANRTCNACAQAESERRKRKRERDALMAAESRQEPPERR